MSKLKEFANALSIFSKVAVGFIVTLSGLLVLDPVRAFIAPYAEAHPRITVIIGGITALGLLLKNPEVRRALHLPPEEREAPAPEQQELPLEDPVAKG